MTKSINQPWAISSAHQTRYGQLWTDLDFIFENKISAENFKTDPMNCLIGRLNIANQNIHMYYKDLIVRILFANSFACLFNSTLVGFLKAENNISML